METKLIFSLPTFPRDRVNSGGVDRQGMGQFISLREAYIPNLSLLRSLEPFKKFVVEDPEGFTVKIQRLNGGGVQTYLSDQP